MQAQQANLSHYQESSLNKPLASLRRLRSETISYTSTADFAKHKSKRWLHAGIYTRAYIVPTINVNKRIWAKTRQLTSCPRIMIWNLFLAQAAIFVSWQGPFKFCFASAFWMVATNLSISSKEERLTGLHQTQKFGQVALDFYLAETDYEIWVDYEHNVFLDFHIE